jgi:Cytochrome c oxidase biogenesis protein Cmc1 like
MPPSLAALSPKEEENVREVLAMRCRAACRPYIQGNPPWKMTIDDADFTDCARGRTVSMFFTCRQKRRRMQECFQA